MRLCPACARGEHNDHVRSGLHTWAGEAKPYRCACVGDCLAAGLVVARLTVAGVIAPRPVNRMD